MTDFELRPTQGEADRLMASLPVGWTCIGLFAFLQEGDDPRFIWFFVIAFPALFVAVLTSYGVFARETGRTLTQLFFPYGGLNEGDSYWRLQTDVWRAQFRLMSPAFFLRVARTSRIPTGVAVAVLALSLTIGLAGVFSGFADIFRA